MSYNMQQFLSTLECYDALICDVQQLMSSLDDATNPAKTTQDSSLIPEDNMVLDDGGDAGPDQGNAALKREDKQDVEDASAWIHMKSWAMELSVLAFTEWLEKNAKRLSTSGKQGTAVKIPLEFHDCPMYKYPGFTLDGAIKGKGKVSMVDRTFGSSADPYSEVAFETEWNFTAYFTLKGKFYKKATVLSFDRTLHFSYSKSDGALEGMNSDEGSNYKWIKGDKEAVPL